MNREILRLAIPNILSNISVPLLSTVDTALMGHLSAAHLGAVGLSAMIFNFIYWNFGFLRMGTTGMVAQAFGAVDEGQATLLLLRGALLGLLIAFVLIVFMSPIYDMSAYLLGVDSTLNAYVSEYYEIRIWAAPATLLLYVLMGWLFGMQDSVSPLILTILINAINIAGSFLLVRWMDYGIQGVAWSTVVAQYCGLIAAVLIIWFKYRGQIKIELIAINRVWQDLGDFLVVNRDLFIRTVSLTLSFIFFYRVSADMGATVLAANVILLQLVNWMSYGIDGFAYAAESLVGKYHGKRDSIHLKRVISLVFYWGATLALLFSLVYFFFGRNLLGVYTNENGVIEYAMQNILMLSLVPLVSFGAYIWDGIFIGFTMSRQMRDSMIFSLIIYGLAYYILRDLYENSIWISFLIFLLARSLLQLVYWKREKNKIINQS